MRYSRKILSLTLAIFIFIVLSADPCFAQVINGNFETYYGDDNWGSWSLYDYSINDPAVTNLFYYENYPYSGSYGLAIKADVGGSGSDEDFHINTAYQTVDFTGWGNLSLWYKFDQSSDTNPYYMDSYECGVDIGGTEHYVQIDNEVSTWTNYKLDVSGYTGNQVLKLFVKVGAYDSRTGWANFMVDDLVLTDYNPNSTISGYITNNLGNSVSAAAVTLNNSGGETNSNDTGYYEITNIPNGIYSITATSPTHEDYSDTVTISVDTEKNITMTRLSPVLTWTDAETTMNDVFLKWRRNIVVDNVRIYKDTETRLLTTVSSGSTLAGLYSDKNQDCDKGYVYWLQPMDNDVAGPKYRIDAKTDPCDGGGGGGGDPTPTPSPTATPGPTPPPWTNITPEEWLNLTLDQKQEILANMSLFPPLLEFQWEDIYVWGIHLFLILCGAVALDSITIQKISEYTGLWAILPGVMFAYLTGYLVI